MKKRRLFLAAAALSVFLVGGCQSRGEEEKPIEAMYIEKGDDFQIFVDTSTDVLFDAYIPEGTEELTTGDLVKIYGDGIDAGKLFRPVSRCDPDRCHQTGNGRGCGKV